jgi:hypothetical protein
MLTRRVSEGDVTIDSLNRRIAARGKQAVQILFRKQPRSIPSVGLTSPSKL